MRWQSPFTLLKFIYAQIHSSTYVRVCMCTYIHLITCFCSFNQLQKLVFRSLTSIERYLWAETRTRNEVSLCESARVNMLKYLFVSPPTLNVNVNTFICMYACVCTFVTFIYIEICSKRVVKKHTIQYWDPNRFLSILQVKIICSENLLPSSIRFSWNLAQWLWRPMLLWWLIYTNIYSHWNVKVPQLFVILKFPAIRYF